MLSANGPQPVQCREIGCPHNPCLHTMKTHLFRPLFSLPTALLALVVAAGSAPSAQATPVAGTFTLGGNTTGTGPWNMTSTDSTFSSLRFVFNSSIKFQDLDSLIYTYDSNLGGIGGGAPRSQVVLDTNGDTIADSFFVIHWGPAGSFSDPTIGNNLSTGNLLALTDNGRYDLTGVGGSGYTDRAAALALAQVNNWDVLRISIILDSFGGNDRDFDIHGVSVTSKSASVPDAANTAVLLGAVLAGLAIFRRRFARS